MPLRSMQRFLQERALSVRGLWGEETGGRGNRAFHHLEAKGLELKTLALSSTLKQNKTRSSQFPYDHIQRINGTNIIAAY